MKKHVARQYFRDEVLLKKVGTKIRDARLEKNLSIESLANECGIDYTQLSRMELGKVNFSISYLSKIAGGLQVNPKDLLP